MPSALFLDIDKHKRVIWPLKLKPFIGLSAMYTSVESVADLFRYLSFQTAESVANDLQAKPIYSEFTNDLQT